MMIYVLRREGFPVEFAETLESAASRMGVTVGAASKLVLSGRRSRGGWLLRREPRVLLCRGRKGDLYIESGLRPSGRSCDWVLDISGAWYGREV